MFESTRGLKNGIPVEFTGELLSVELGPGLLGSLYDGLQNPLNDIAGEYQAISLTGELNLDPCLIQKNGCSPLYALKAPGVRAGDHLGYVDEGIFRHIIMVPFYMTGAFEIAGISGQREMTIDSRVATLKDENSVEKHVSMSFRWPVKQPVKAYTERLFPDEQRS